MQCFSMVRPLIVVLTAAVSFGLPVHAQQSSDVIVYGSTPGGFCAAIAAAREGCSVILLEPGNHVGGMSTGGLSHCDSNQMVRSTVMGLFHEWHSRIVKDYTDRGLDAPYGPDIKDQSRWTFEPHVAMRVTKQMLDEAGVVVHKERNLLSATKTNGRITSVKTAKGEYSAKVFVDGTYEGDLMAAAGVDWTIGREGRSEFGETLAGRQYPKAKMKIDGFDDSGKPLPLTTGHSAGKDDVGDQNVMTYSFRLCLTEQPENRIPMPKPDHYDPARFEIVRRALKAGERRIGFDLYPLPGNKLDGNNSIGGQFSLGLVGGGTNWHSANAEERQAIWEAHRQYTLEFIHFLTTDPTVPDAIRKKYLQLGLCRDEFTDHDHFPPALYVRESRRMVGMYVISQNDILETPQKTDPIAVSSFPIDSHDCRRIALEDGSVVNEGTIFPVRRKNPKQGFAYHVPYRSILPQREQCNNLLVPVALSCTHVGISSLRIEGTWMIVGQSAGVAAALAAKADQPVQLVPYSELRDRLLAQGQVLELPAIQKPSADAKASQKFVPVAGLPGIVLDDPQAQYSGEWNHSTNFRPSIGNGYVFHGDRDSTEPGDGKATATFRLTVPKSGEYKLLMAYSAHPTRARNVPVIIRSGSSVERVTVDQTQPLPAGRHFRFVSTVHLQAGVETTITISNQGAVGFVIVDALQLLAD